MASLCWTASRISSTSSMISAYFKGPERELLLSKVHEWNELKGSGRQRNEEGDLVNLKDDFIDDLVGEFFAQFPHRDIFQNPTGPDAMPQEERDRIHTVRTCAQS